MVTAALRASLYLEPWLQRGHIGKGHAAPLETAVLELQLHWGTSAGGIATLLTRHSCTGEQSCIGRQLQLALEVSAALEK